LLYVEVALGRRVCRLIVGVSANNNEFGGGVAVESESDVVEACLAFVVDTHRTFRIAFKRDTAERTHLRDWRRRRSDDGDCGGGRGVFAEIVNHVACYGDCP